MLINAFTCLTFATLAFSNVKHFHDYYVPEVASKIPRDTVKSHEVTTFATSSPAMGKDGHEVKQLIYEDSKVEKYPKSFRTEDVQQTGILN